MFGALVVAALVFAGLGSDAQAHSRPARMTDPAGASVGATAVEIRPVTGASVEGRRTNCEGDRVCSDASDTGDATSPAAPELQKAVPSPAVPAEKSHPSAFARWVDVQAANLGVRYRAISNSQDVTTASQMQHSESLKARLRLDPAGRYALNIGAFTGSTYTGSWNNSGVGTGDRFTRMYLKYLYFAAVPAPGIELQYGSLYFSRGENTEATSYDNDAWVMGARASVKRPAALFFDEISATQGNLGPQTAINAFDRLDGLATTNYWQGLVSKRAGKHLVASTDYTRAFGVGTVRGAFSFRHRGMRVLDTVRLEAYRRFPAGPAPAAVGYVVYGERAFARRLVAGGGWADIDVGYGSLNGDRFGRGRRMFVNGAVTLSPEFAVQVFYQAAPSPRFQMANKTRFDVILSYNLLKTLQRSGLF